MKRPPGRPPLDDEAATGSIRVRETQAQRIELRRVTNENGILCERASRRRRRKARVHG